MRKRNGTILCVLLALVALTFAAVLPASAAGEADAHVLGVYYYDADGNPIKTDPVFGMELSEYFGADLANANKVVGEIADHAKWLQAARTEIRLFANVPTELTILANTTTTLNLNGFVLSAAGATAPLTVAAGGTLTVTDTSADKSGSIAYTGSAAVSAIDNRGKLTVETANVTTASTAALISNSGETARIAISGGSFGTNGAGNFANADGARIAVSGGIFTEAVLDEYCAAGYETLTMESGKYSVKLSSYDDRFGEALTVVGQAAVTEGGTAYYPIDAVFGIDGLNYTTVGVEYSVLRTEASSQPTVGTKETATVYTALHLTTGGTQTTCKPADIDASYLYTVRLLLDTSAYTEANTVIRLTPYAKGTDGTVYRGRTIELSGDVCAANGVTLFGKGE